MHARLAFIALFTVCACSSHQSAFRSFEASDSRPGLATVWGETRASPLREVFFERASESPIAQGKLFYDDRRGLANVAADLHEAEIPTFAGLETLVVDEQGRPYETVSAAGRIYVAGAEGRRYRLRLHNRTGQRLEVVASVDGLDVMDGGRAGLEKRGYLVDPHSTLTIEGFRRNLEEVAAFRFGAVADSYAARTGDDRNVGVIGFAFFDERRARVQDDDELERRRDAKPFSNGRFAQPPMPFNTAP